jgi:hypothetical protein
MPKTEPIRRQPTRMQTTAPRPPVSEDRPVKQVPALPSPPRTSYKRHHRRQRRRFRLVSVPRKPTGPPCRAFSAALFNCIPTKFSPRSGGPRPTSPSSNQRRRGDDDTRPGSVDGRRSGHGNSGTQAQVSDLEVKISWPGSRRRRSPTLRRRRHPPVFSAAAVAAVPRLVPYIYSPEGFPPQLERILHRPHRHIHLPTLHPHPLLSFPTLVPFASPSGPPPPDLPILRHHHQTASTMCFRTETYVPPGDFHSAPPRHYSHWSAHDGSPRQYARMPRGRRTSYTRSVEYYSNGSGHLPKPDPYHGKRVYVRGY